MNEARYWAVVPAAGVGRRMNTAIAKQYLSLAGRTVIEHTLDTLLRHPRIAGVVVAIGAEDTVWETLRFTVAKPLLRTIGGKERCDSVLNSLSALAQRVGSDDWILVHDAVRPCLRIADIDRLIVTLENDPVGGLLATPARDTMKRADSGGRVSATVNRDGLWRALTPQMFRYSLLLTALQTASRQGRSVTDEAAAVEAMGLMPRLVEGRSDNIKITRPEDLEGAEFYLTPA